MNRVGVFSQFVIVTELKSSALTKTDNSNPYFPQGIVLGIKNNFDNKNCLHCCKIGYKMQVKYRS